MTILVGAETVLLILLALLVVALLRSHAEILRRLGPEGEPRVEARPGPPGRSTSATTDGKAPDVAGRTRTGDAVQIGIQPGGPPMLLAFLTSGCATCERFWSDLDRQQQGLLSGLRLVVVTKDPSEESPTRLDRLAPANVEVVMSSAAWGDYGVPASPYFVHVDGASARVHGEGTAGDWEALGSLLRDAMHDIERAERAGNPSRARASGPERAERIDADLAAAGIGPGHSSLYPRSTQSSGNGEEQA